MLRIQREKIARGNDNCVEMDVLVERGRQLHSTAIGDALINLFRGTLTRRDAHKSRPEALRHATGHQTH